MRGVILLPTWLIVKLMRPALPNGHAWKTQMPTYRQWRHGATDLCVAFGFVFWSGILSGLFIAGMYAWRAFNG
jgi:hypothetical protein